MILAPIITAIAATAVQLVATFASTPPCEFEDSVSCYWDADERGNGVGRSFTVDEHGNVTYWR